MGDGAMAAASLTGVILAGGKSSRFGSDKASAPLLGKPMLQWAASALSGVCGELVIVVAEGQELPPFEVTVPVRTVVDRYPGKGPLAGLATGFSAVRTELCYATSCDAPLIQPALVELLAGLADDYDIVCPLVEDYLQPLTAVYRAAACGPVFEEFIARDVLKITAAFGPLRMRVVREDEVRAADPELESFVNANRPEVVAEIEERLRGR
jgi:molybdopterin-guanine dinucleotide biosynthesis protein A